VTDASRLAFFDVPEAAPQPSTTRARVDGAASGHVVATAAPPGPSERHRFHGAIRIGRTREIRVSTQPAGTTPGGTAGIPRLVIRVWYQKLDGSWWTFANEPGIAIHAPNAAAFAEAVAAASKQLADEAK
jgi:hypothetical protein